MKLSVVEIIFLVTGVLAAVVTAVHRIRRTVLKNISSRASKYGHYAIACLLAGVVEVWFCIVLRNGMIPVEFGKNKLEILMCVSGGTLFMGIWNMIRYYRSF